MTFIHVGQAEAEGESTEQQDSAKSEPAPEVRKKTNVSERMIATDDGVRCSNVLHNHGYDRAS